MMKDATHTTATLEWLYGIRFLLRFLFRFRFRVTESTESESDCKGQGQAAKGLELRKLHCAGRADWRSCEMLSLGFREIRVCVVWWPSRREDAVVLFVSIFFFIILLLAGTATGISLFQGAGAHSSDCVWYPGKGLFLSSFCKAAGVSSVFTARNCCQNSFARNECGACLCAR